MNTIKSILEKISGAFKATGGYALRHKIQAGIAIFVLAGGGYYGYASYKKDHTPAQYVLAAASIAPIQTTVTGSGQVASSHELDLSPKSSGVVTGVYVKAGDHVAAGALIATIDSTDAQKTVRDAQASLESARISYAQSIASSDTSIENARDSGFDAVASAETTQPDVLSHLDSIITNNDDLNSYADIVRDTEPSIDDAVNRARASYDAAVSAHDAATAAYRTASRTSSPQDTLALMDTEYASLVATTQAAKDMLAALTLVDQTLKSHNLLEVPSDLATNIAEVTSDSSSITSATTKVASAQTSLEGDIRSLGSGVPLDVQSAQLSLTKAENSYQDALDALADYSVRAPFAGTIANVNVQKFDTAGGSAAAATLITDQQYAELSLNETDAEKVQAGQAAELTFDAIDGLTLNGTVAEIDPVGTVSQGVVSYSVKIGLGDGDSRVRPGMTVNATIITASKAAALVVPSAAIKTQGDTYYVEVAVGGAGAQDAGADMASTTRRVASSTAAFGNRFGSSTSASSTRAFTGSGAMFGARTQTVSADTVTLKRVPVAIGLQSDTMTEVLTGLSTGERVVTQTIAQSGKTSTTSSAPSLFGGGNRAGAVRSTGAAAGTARSGGNATFVAKPGSGGGFGG